MILRGNSHSALSIYMAGLSYYSSSHRPGEFRGGDRARQIELVRLSKARVNRIVILVVYMTEFKRRISARRALFSLDLKLLSFRSNEKKRIPFLRRFLRDYGTYIVRGVNRLADVRNLTLNCKEAKSFFIFEKKKKFN